MRLPGWEKLLYERIRELEKTPFQWGVHDCCLFAADIVKAITGNDYAADFRGKYSTEDEAAVLQKQHGGLSGLITGLLGESLPVSHAGRGDVVMIESGEGDALGICIGVDSIFAGKTGLMRRRTSTAYCTWRVE